VRVALTSELTRKQVAADFGVGFSTLSRWIQLDRRNPEKPSAQSMKKLAAYITSVAHTKSLNFDRTANLGF